MYHWLLDMWVQGTRFALTEIAIRKTNRDVPLELTQTFKSPLSDSVDPNAMTMKNEKRRADGNDVEWLQTL